ncbi:ligase-associated DNA damage response endonuclease PdeM [Tropicimonas sp. S265A]|uniref:ligase-associated DNA damage response endonuclease PdeM n=1 Tax=Tropicimonas sp. S265A TaxID=3415134 RepID=UPI003C7DF2A6
MNMLPFTFAGLNLHALPSGALWWESARCLMVADLHLGKSERMARRGGALLPPYEVTETLNRLKEDIALLSPAEVLCLGDSFDDTACFKALHNADLAKLSDLRAKCNWVWITGNHDPVGVDAQEMFELTRGPLVLRHIAHAGALAPGTLGEVSGHYHPKHQVPTRGGRVSRACFLVTPTRMILPAYGAYTGGLQLCDPAFDTFRTPGSYAILTGSRPVAVPLDVPSQSSARVAGR